MITLAILAVILVVPVIALLWRRSRAVIFGFLSDDEGPTKRVLAKISGVFDRVFNPDERGEPSFPFLLLFVFLNSTLAGGQFASLIPQLAAHATYIAWALTVASFLLNLTILSAAVVHAQVELNQLAGLPDESGWRHSGRPFVGSNVVFGIASFFFVASVVALLRLIAGRVELFTPLNIPGSPVGDEILFVLWSLPIAHYAVLLASYLGDQFFGEPLAIATNPAGHFAAGLIHFLGIFFIVALIQKKMRTNSQAARWIRPILELDEAAQKSRLEKSPPLRQQFVDTALDPPNNATARGTIRVVLKRNLSSGFPEQFCRQLHSYNSRIKVFGLDEIADHIEKERPEINFELLGAALRHPLQRRRKYRPKVRKSLLHLTVVVLERLAKQPDRDRIVREWASNGFVNDYVSMVAGGHRGPSRDRDKVYGHPLIVQAIKAGFELKFEQLAIRLFENLHRSQRNVTRLAAVEGICRFLDSHLSLSDHAREKLVEVAGRYERADSPAEFARPRFDGKVSDAVQTLIARLKKTNTGSSRPGQTLPRPAERKILPFRSSHAA
jgi:hypothetical protein